MKDSPLSDALQSYSGQQAAGRSAGVQYIKSLHSVDNEHEESSRKRGRWLEQANESKSLINFDFNRTISSSPLPPSEHLLSLANKVPLAADAADLELSIKASTSAISMQHMQDFKSSCNFGSFNTSSFNLQANPPRSLNPQHQHELIARLLAAASANNSSRETNVQALHKLNHGQLGLPLLAYNVQQGKQYIGISNQGLTKVNPSTYRSQQGINLRDDIMSNTTLVRPNYNSMIKGDLINSYSCNDSKLHTSIEGNDMEEVAKEGELLISKVAMQKYVKVVMEGRSIERKVCLEDYDSYESFARALFDMYGAHDDKHLIMNLSHTPTDLHNAIPGYKIAYQDYEGDLLLAGDLPWREFTQAAKQIKILPMIKPKQHLNGS